MCEVICVQLLRTHMHIHQSTHKYEASLLARLTPFQMHASKTEKIVIIYVIILILSVSRIVL